jgi:diguanylate cyclase (GGDEF)-like protein
MPQTDPGPSAAHDPEHLRLTAELALAREQVALLTARLAEAERLADRDVLTPLLNRRAFLREVQRAIAIARRYKSPASVIYFDLNDFKGVNDRYGHAAGDAVLIAVAERLLAAVRAEDVVGRIGGDEFAVLLQRADAPAASAKAEALLDTVAGEPVHFQHRDITIGVTFGVREIAAADSAEQALAEADANMYVGKPQKTERKGP